MKTILSKLKYQGKTLAPSIDTGDATQTIDTEAKFNEYKKDFIEKFGNPDIVFSNSVLYIMECEKFDTWKADYLKSKFKAIQSGIY